jgi:hypothetical protein
MMTFKKFILATFVQLIVFTGLKIFAFLNFDFSIVGYFYAYLGLTAVLATIFSRMLGVINFFEAFFICGLWFLLDFFTDILFTSKFIGLKFYTIKIYWLGFLIMLFCIFWLHKKFHIQVRNEMHSKHH